MEQIDATPVREAVKLLMECKKRTPPDLTLLNTALVLLHVALTGKRCSPDGPVDAGVNGSAR